MREPRDYAEENGSSGYAVVALPFASGDLLALRRFPGYTSVWHCDPSGRWTFYQDAPCGDREDFNSIVLAPIEVEWTGPRSLSVRVDGAQTLRWDLSLAATPVTRFVNALSDFVPALWRAVVRFMARAGKLNLYARTQAAPKYVWAVECSRAAIGDQELFAPFPIAFPYNVWRTLAG
jgi:hypothetical protein